METPRESLDKADNKMGRKVLRVISVCCVVGILLAYVIKLPYGDFEGPGWDIWVTAAIAIAIMFFVLGIALSMLFGKPVFAFLRKHTWTLGGSVLLFTFICVAFVVFLFAGCCAAEMGPRDWRQVPNWLGLGR
jgi:Kef-type K+ transport system membrane component KefB